MITLDGNTSKYLLPFFEFRALFALFTSDRTCSALITKVICLHFKFTVMDNEDYNKHKVYIRNLFEDMLLKRKVLLHHIRMDHMVLRKGVNVLKKVNNML